MQEKDQNHRKKKTENFSKLIPIQEKKSESQEKTGNFSSVSMMKSTTLKSTVRFEIKVYFRILDPKSWEHMQVSHHITHFTLEIFLTKWKTSFSDWARARYHRAEEFSDRAMPECPAWRSLQMQHEWEQPVFEDFEILGIVSEFL